MSVNADGGFCGPWKVLAGLWLPILVVQLLCGMVLDFCLDDVCLMDGDAS